MSEINPIKTNKNIDVSSLNKIYTNKNDAQNSSNSLNVISSKQYYEDADLELFQVDADNDGVLDDVYRIDKISEDGTRTSMGYVNDSEVNISKPISSEPESIQAIYSNSEHAKEFHKFENVKKQINENTKYVGDPIQHNMKEVSSVSDYTAGAGDVILPDYGNTNLNDKVAANINNQSDDTQSSKKSILKTAALFEASKIEGMLKPGEKVRDFVETTGTNMMGKINVGAQTTKMAIKDLFGKVTEDDYKELDRRLKVYDEMMEETKADVKQNLLEDYIVNPFYEKTGLLEGAYGGEIVRQIGNGIGETFEIVGLSMAAAYLGVGGTAEAAGSELIGSLLKGKTAKTLRILLAGVNGAGEGMQTAFQKGSDVSDGMMYGYAKGLWNSAQWIIGENIVKLNPFSGGSMIVNQLKNSGLHVALHSLDSASEGFVQPAIEKIYNNKEYNEIFKDNGGWKNVGTQAIIGAALSSINEISNITSVAKNSSNAIEKTSTTTEAVETPNNTQEQLIGIEDKTNKNMMLEDTSLSTMSEETQSSGGSQNQNTQSNHQNYKNANESNTSQSNSESHSSQNQNTQSNHQNYKNANESNTSQSNSESHSSQSSNYTNNMIDYEEEMKKINIKYARGEITRKERNRLAKELHPDNHVNNKQGRDAA